MCPSSSDLRIPFVSTDQMREVDRAMEEDYGISLIQMMENAGRNLARLARDRFLCGDPTGRSILVLAGTGGNGGGGLVCARWLHNWGASVLVWATAAPSEFSEVPRHQLAILGRLGVPVRIAGEVTNLPQADLVVDAIIGYSLRGAPTGRAAALICAANTHSLTTLALDVPSGVDTTTGAVHEPAIRATATLTLALPKQGLRTCAAKGYVGELYLGDISVPPELYRRSSIGIDVGPIFAKDEIIRVW